VAATPSQSKNTELPWGSVRPTQLTMGEVAGIELRLPSLRALAAVASSERSFIAKMSIFSVHCQI
jgi:hypothetical protein